jgi:hypothetical protein
MFTPTINVTPKITAMIVKEFRSFRLGMFLKAIEVKDKDLPLPPLPTYNMGNFSVMKREVLLYIKVKYLDCA